MLRVRLLRASTLDKRFQFSWFSAMLSSHDIFSGNFEDQSLSTENWSVLRSRVAREKQTNHVKNVDIEQFRNESFFARVSSYQIVRDYSQFHTVLH